LLWQIRYLEENTQIGVLQNQQKKFQFTGFYVSKLLASELLNPESE